MKLNIDVELRSGRSGIEARSPLLRLTRHGFNEQDALELLKNGIIAWCLGLQSLGKLEKILGQKRLQWESNGESISVDFKVNNIIT